MSTLLEETRSEFEEHKQSLEDIEFIGSRDGKLVLSWEQFCAAADQEYDSGYGGQEVASDLVIVFKDGSWLQRGEYDGSEWWEYMVRPKLSANPQSVNKVIREAGYWGSLANINEDILGNSHE